MTLYLIPLVCFGSAGGSAQKSGAHCFCASNSIILILGFFLLLFTTLLFLIGGISDKLVCKTFKDPTSSELYDAANEAFNTFLKGALSIEDVENVTFEFDKVIDLCAKNGSIYNVFNLSLIYNISKLTNWQETYNISSIIDNDIDEIEKGIDELVERLVIDNKTRAGIETIAEEFSRLPVNIFDYISDINISDLVPKHTLDNVTYTLSKLKQNGISVDNIESVIDVVGMVTTTITTDVAKHLTEISDFVVDLNNTGIYSESCDLECTVHSVLELGDYTRDYIDQTTRSDIISATDDTIQSVLDLGTNLIGSKTYMFTILIIPAYFCYIIL